MDGWREQDGSGTPDGGENVIRLPTDWVGPREELIPIGAPPPAASDFWSEDSAALHDAVQAPGWAAPRLDQAACSPPPAAAEGRPGTAAGGTRGDAETGAAATAA